MNNADFRARARMNLGGSIFHNDWLTGLAVCLVGNVISGFFPLILMGPIAFGEAVIFLKKARGGGRIVFEDLFLGFELFGETLLLGLMQGLFVFLWALIPVAGIFIAVYKGYGWALSFYIKVDNPSLEWRECMDRSVMMMHGHRWQLFCLQLSFIGWFLLGALACVIGAYWVMPYQEAAKANFYEALRLGTAMS